MHNKPIRVLSVHTHHLNTGKIEQLKLKPLKGMAHNVNGNANAMQKFVCNSFATLL